MSVVTDDGSAQVTIERLTDTRRPAVRRVEGRQIFAQTDTSTDTVVQTLDGGARILEVMHDEDAPSEFVYRVDLPVGADLLPQDDGTILLGRETQDGDQVVVDAIGLIAAPWALDANGEALAADYSIEGSLITMHVPTSSDTAFPVVADPTYSSGGFRVSWSIYTPHLVTVDLNKARSADYWDGNLAVCIGLAFVPAVGPVISRICLLGNIVGRLGYGYCVRMRFDTIRGAVNPATAVSTSLYRYGFCR